MLLENLTKTFGDCNAVKDLTLHIADRELVTLLGPSGCGKSTTLRCIAGLETPSSGNIYIGDVLVNELPPKDRDIAMVFQSYALYPHMSVYENLSFPLRIRKIDKKEINEKVRKTADLLKIDKLLGRKPKELSGGEQQRVALGRAIIREPKVFLLDEPLSNLDARLRVLMRTELKALQEDLETTMIYVTHDQLEAMSMSTRIALLKDGTLQQFGAPNEIYNKPANDFVASFIGAMPINLIACSFEENTETGKAFLDAGAFSLDVSSLKDVIKERTASSELVLGVRSENIIEYEKGMKTEAIDAKIYVIELVGSENIVSLKVGDYILKMTASPDFAKTCDEVTRITFKENQYYIFDKKTGKTII